MKESPTIVVCDMLRITEQMLQNGKDILRIVPCDMGNCRGCEAPIIRTHSGKPVSDEIRRRVESVLPKQGENVIPQQRDPREVLGAFFIFYIEDGFAELRSGRSTKMVLTSNSFQTSAEIVEYLRTFAIDLHGITVKEVARTRAKKGSAFLIERKNI